MDRICFGSQFEASKGAINVLKRAYAITEKGDLKAFDKDFEGFKAIIINDMKRLDIDTVKLSSACKPKCEKKLILKFKLGKETIKSIISPPKRYCVNTSCFALPETRDMIGWLLAEAKGLKIPK